MFMKQIKINLGVNISKNTIYWCIMDCKKLAFNKISCKPCLKTMSIERFKWIMLEIYAVWGQVDSLFVQRQKKKKMHEPDGWNC